MRLRPIADTVPSGQLSPQLTGVEAKRPGPYAQASRTRPPDVGSTDRPG